MKALGEQLQLNWGQTASDPVSILNANRFSWTPSNRNMRHWQMIYRTPLFNCPGRVTMNLKVGVWFWRYKLLLDNLHCLFNCGKFSLQAIVKIAGQKGRMFIVFCWAVDTKSSLFCVRVVVGICIELGHAEVISKSVRKTKEDMETINSKYVRKRNIKMVVKKKLMKKENK